MIPAELLVLSAAPGSPAEDGLRPLDGLGADGGAEPGPARPAVTPPAPSTAAPRVPS
ncbi:hypothetical protein [Streptomyces venezuelae]|uniref:hypothetical protein n=1 Tax=Streptomyces venezuelae TaxID=54571 RepID=UPI003320EEEB